MKILSMGSPATTYVFNKKINDTYGGEHIVKKVKEFYTIGHLMSSYASIKKFADKSNISPEYKEFLNWNFENNGFWEKLKSFQPDILLMDLFSDIYFGNLVLSDGTYVTRNIRLNKTFPSEAVRETFNDKNFYKNLQYHVKLFLRNVNSLSPKTHVIFNNARFPEKMSINGLSQKKYNHDFYKFSIDTIDRYNNAWAKIDNLIYKNEGCRRVNFDKKHSFAEQNFSNGKHWYYFYNQNYYSDVQTQVEEIAATWDLGPTVKKITADDKISAQIDANVVLLDVPSKHTDLRAFRENKKAYEQVKKIIKQDYVLHGNIGNLFRFIKRKNLVGVYPKYLDLHYRIIPPKDKRTYGPNRLLVRFLGFSDQKSTSIFKRNFKADFTTLKDSIAKNTYILEIGDMNLVAGSFYTNTENFPDYEKQISELVELIADKYLVDSSRIVMYGTSRGATGALINGGLNNYKILAADPVVDGQAWFDKGDLHYTANIRKINLMNDVLSSLKDYSLSKENVLVMGTSNVGVTFLPNLQLPSDKVTMIDLNMDIFDHAELNGKSVPLQLAMINYLLIKDDLSIRNSNEEILGGVVLSIKDLKHDSVNLSNVNKFRIRIDDFITNEDFNADFLKGFILIKTDELYQFWEKY